MKNIIRFHVPQSHIRSGIEVTITELRVQQYAYTAGLSEEHYHGNGYNIIPQSPKSLKTANDNQPNNQVPTLLNKLYAYTSN
jgi:hypothetical protein